MEGEGSGGWRHGYQVTFNTTGNIASISGAGLSSLFQVGTSSCSYTDLAHNGSTISCPDANTIIYTAHDATTIKFDKSSLSGGASYTVPTEYLPTQIAKPDGEIVTLTYKRAQYTGAFGVVFYVVRLQSVSNNYGYMLKYSYRSNDPTSPDDWLTVASVAAINLATSYCDPIADACAGSWPTVSYSWTTLTDDSGAAYAAHVVTLPSGRTRTYKYAYLAYNGDTSIRILGVKDPLSTKIAISYIYNDSLSICNRKPLCSQVLSATKNGVTYTYSWSEDANGDGTTNYIGVVSSLGMRRWSSVTNESTGLLRYIYHGSAGSQDISGYTSQYVDDYRYDTYGRLTDLSSGGQVVYHVAYDDRGNQWLRMGDDKITYRQNFSSDCPNIKTCNKPYSITGAIGTTNYTYDPVHGGVLTATFPAATTGAARGQMRTSYTQLYAYYKNATGSIVQAPTGIWKSTGTSTCATLASCAGTADEAKTAVSYGVVGIANNLLPTATTVAAGDGSINASTAVSYDIIGNKISEDGPLAGAADTTTWLYDADRRVTQVVGPDPDGAGTLHNRSVKTDYNASGQVMRVSSGTSNADGSGFNPITRTDYSYDQYGRQWIVQVSAAGSIQSRTDYSYDAQDRLECVATRMNPALFATATTPACSLGAEGAFGPDRITRNVYDTYDRVQKVQTGYATALQREVAYNWSGVILKGIYDQLGNYTAFEYDGGGRLNHVVYSKPAGGGMSSTDQEWWNYDYRGLLSSRQLRDGRTIDYTYDNLSRQTLAHLESPVDGNDRDITTSYDLLGRVMQVDDGAGRKVNFSYDALGRKTSETPQLTGGSVTYQYDAAGRRIRTTWPDGTFYVTYDYDTLGELVAIRESGVTSGPGVLATYNYDDQGKALSLTRGNGVNQNYSYDVLGRLQNFSISHPSAGNSYTFAYNPVGQLVSRGMTNDAYAWTQAAAVNRDYTVNGLNQYTASGAVVPTYDGRGNMTSAGSTTFVYDSKNHLTNFGTNSFGYDALGRLVSQGTPATRFVYDGSDIIAETDGSNNVLRRYVHIPGTDNVVTWYEGSGTTDRRWLAHDERGSVTLITNTAGTQLAINSYDEYGIPATTNLGRFQYTGQTWMPELGMYNYKARIYSPTMGRFMQTDPSGYADGLNWYDYVHGDPINGTDPTGNSCRMDGSPIGNFNGNGGWLGTRYTTVCNGVSLGTSTGSSADGSSGRNGDRDGDRKKNTTKEETDTCAGLRTKAADAKKSLPDYLTRDAIWNNAGNLKAEIANANLNSSFANVTSEALGNPISGSAIAGGLSALARMRIIAARAAGSIGFAIGMYAYVAGKEGSYYSDQAQALQARLQDLQAKEDGTCP